MTRWTRLFKLVDPHRSLNVFGIENRLADFGRGLPRQSHFEGSAVLRGGGDIDSSTVRSGDFEGDVQAHAYAAGTGFPRMVGTGAAHQRVEDSCHFTRWAGVIAQRQLIQVLAGTDAACEDFPFGAEGKLLLECCRKPEVRDQRSEIRKKSRVC